MNAPHSPAMLTWAQEGRTAYYDALMRLVATGLNDEAALLEAHALADTIRRLDDDITQAYIDAYYTGEIEGDALRLVPQNLPTLPPRPVL